MSTTKRRKNYKEISRMEQGELPVSKGSEYEYQTFSEKDLYFFKLLIAGIAIEEMAKAKEMLGEQVELAQEFEYPRSYRDELLKAVLESQILDVILLNKELIDKIKRAITIEVIKIIRDNLIKEESEYLGKGEE